MKIINRCFAFALACVATSPAQTVSGILTPVLTRGYDNARTGANTQETTLTQADVAQRGIRKLFSLVMEGDARGAEAQPLILPRVMTVDGNTRDVVLLCSMNNTVHAYDANTSDELWTVKLGIPVNGSSAIDMHTINDRWGILSTGVVDPQTQILYVVAWISPDGTPQRATHSLFALRVGDGSFAKPPLSLAPAIYTTPSGSVQRYSSAMRKQRSSLALATVNGRKTVFLASGTVLETNAGAAGWILAYDVATARLSAALAMSAGYGAGIWMSGTGLAVDAAGFLYGATGNGSFDARNDWGETIFKAQYTYAAGTLAGTLAVVDWWSPYSDNGRLGLDPTKSFAKPSKLANKLAGVSAPSEEAKHAEHAMPVNSMAERDLTRATVVGKLTYLKPASLETAAYSDEDLGSAGVSLIPEYNAVLSAGKDGIAYLVNQRNMGRTLPADFANAAANYAKLLQPPLWYTYYPGPVDAAPQDSSTLDFLFEGKTRHMHSTSVQYTSPVHGKMLFCWGENSSLRAWSMAPTGALTFLAQSAEIASPNSTTSPGGMPGGFMSLSSNANQPGTAILWALVPYGDANAAVTNGRLLAYDPDTFVTFANGTQGLRILWDSKQQNLQFLYNKFNVPVVSGGKVFVTTYAGTVDVYGLS